MLNKKTRKTIFTLLFFIGLFVFLNSLPKSSEPTVRVRKGSIFSRVSQVRYFVQNIFNRDSTEKPSQIFTNNVFEEESIVVNVVEEVSPAVVSIVVKTLVFDPFSGPEASEEGIGTGFVVDPTGIIVTNSHVVDDNAGEYSVILGSGEAYEVNKIHLDPISDLAILEIDARNLKTVELGDSEAVKVGQKAIAIGNALGRYSNTVTTGVVSGITRQLVATSGFGDMKTYENAIQTDAALNPGNSGGPLLSSAGQVIGINVATSVYADNIGFAIPVNTLKPILKTFFEMGRIVRPYLGVRYTIITKEISQIRGFPEGAYISGVINGSPAKKAGLLRGDIVTSIDGKLITSDNTLAKMISQKSVGDIVEIVLNRDDTELKIYTTLAESGEN
jgi:S1-C subfamily serine protease